MIGHSYCSSIVTIKTLTKVKSNTFFPVELTLIKLYYVYMAWLTDMTCFMLDVSP